VSELLRCAQVESLPMLLEDGSVNAGIAFFTISYVVINVWTILQVACSQALNALSDLST
jgi:hypothetical protein